MSEHPAYVDIGFAARFDGMWKLVTIKFVYGRGEINYDLYIDHRFWGTLVKVGGQWILYTPKPVLSSDDILILGDMIDEVLERKSSG